ncbi:MAG: hypothetical protein FJ128_10515 [Deltaproteobacteria bacterium]|nr:hypothetical protein [Deltaproteobacteria bacterium]
MPAKYHIHTRPAPARYPALGKSTVLDWQEGCLRCTVCVKQSCPYNAFKQRDFDVGTLSDTIEGYCKNCFRCVQGCPRELIAKTPSPQFQRLGDAYWTPEIIQSTWYQAETGKIPVSGAGYGGRFSGPGFDAIWTDMSEIVRPTRDGIHGREYISTAIDLGRKPLFLIFDDQGRPAFEPPPLLEIPLPVLLAEPPRGAGPEPIRRAVAQAARDLGTLALLPREHITAELEPFAAHLAPSYPADALDLNDPLLAQVKVVELQDHDAVLEQIELLKRRHPHLIVSIKAPATGAAAERLTQLAAAGAEILHLAAGPDAQGLEDAAGVHLKDLIRQAHLRLVQDHLRDTVTLLAGGGVAMAEHVPKAIICGADGVIIDLPLLLALECRLCRTCAPDACPVHLETLNVRRAAQRLVNLMGAWNNQLLEILGAMGLREVRRLRGEVGRAMFVEDLEREIFGPLFTRNPVESLRREGE